jgi:sporulation protein YpjB
MFVFWKSLAAALMAAGVWIGAGRPAEAAAAASAIAEAAESPPAAAAFLRTAEALYEAAESGDAAAVRRYAADADILLRGLPMQKIASAEGVETLARSVVRLKRSVAAVRADPEEWRRTSAEIRLAADALVHPDRPLWHRYRSILAEDLRGLEEAMGDPGQRDAEPGLLKRCQDHYALIRTAAMLHAEPFTIERADSALQYAERVLKAASSSPELRKGVIPALRDSLAGLFPGEPAADTALIAPATGPSWGWPAFMGTFIVSILSWAGWQRYKHAAAVTPRGSLPPERRGRR